MWEIATSGSMSGGKRSGDSAATAPLIDSTRAAGREGINSLGPETFFFAHHLILTKDQVL